MNRGTESYSSVRGVVSRALGQAKPPPCAGPIQGCGQELTADRTASRSWWTPGAFRHGIARVFLIELLASHKCIVVRGNPRPVCYRNGVVSRRATRGGQRESCVLAAAASMCLQ